ncbi:MAG: hypothetical protein AAF334_06125 [Pseudomonadota bacterium]
MQEMIKLFGELNFNQPAQRRKVYNFLCGPERSSPNDAGFMLWAHDYIYNPTDAKAQALWKVFIRKYAPLEINMGHNQRAQAMSMLGHQDCLKLQHTPAISTNVTNFKVEGGFKPGAAGNYNIITQVIDFCFDKMDKSATLDLRNMVRKGDQIPASVAADWNKEYIADALNPYYGGGALKALGVL